MIASITDILYFHGLDSELSDAKRKFLQQFGNVTGQTYNYKDPEVLEFINPLFKGKDLSNTILIGSSFGGYLANSFSMLYDIPCLLFNPALASRSFDLDVSQPFDNMISSLSYIVLGKQDDVINCNDNAAFIADNLKGLKEICIEESLGHRIPIDIFEKHVSLFFEQINRNNSTQG